MLHSLFKSTPITYASALISWFLTHSTPHRSLQFPICLIFKLLHSLWCHARGPYPYSSLLTTIPALTSFYANYIFATRPRCHIFYHTKYPCCLPMHSIRSIHHSVHITIKPPFNPAFTVIDRYVYTSTNTIPTIIPSPLLICPIHANTFNIFFNNFHTIITSAYTNVTKTIYMSTHNISQHITLQHGTARYTTVQHGTPQ